MHRVAISGPDVRVAEGLETGCLSDDPYRGIPWADFCQELLFVLADQNGRLWSARPRGLSFASSSASVLQMANVVIGEAVETTPALASSRFRANSEQITLAEYLNVNNHRSPSSEPNCGAGYR